MVRHDGKRSEIVLAQIGAFEERSNHDFRNGLLPQVHGTGSCAVEISIPPDKSSPARKLMRRRISAMGKTPMQVPGNEEPPVLRIDVWQAASRMHRSNSANAPVKLSHNCESNCGARTRACSVHTRVNAFLAIQAIPQRKWAPTRLIRANQPLNISRSHECERCTHECVRHNAPANGPGREPGDGLLI
jgi:hypothetical protein